MSPKLVETTLELLLSAEEMKMTPRVFHGELCVLTAFVSADAYAFGAIAWDSSLPAYPVGGATTMKTAASADKDARETCLGAAEASRISRASANCQVVIRFHDECVVRVVGKDGADAGIVRHVPLGTAPQATLELSKSECADGSCNVTSSCDQDDVQ
ncbi:MAG: DUF4189 domain-containing protein [Caulobacter sp.]|nr:DUF4189 domain-containing protein [Vitreoscilla sp.]